MSSIKISVLMDLPPVVLSGNLFTDGGREVYYPAPLLQLWMKSIRHPHDSSSGRCTTQIIFSFIVFGGKCKFGHLSFVGRDSAPQPPEPSLSSRPESVNFPDDIDFVSH